MKSSISIPTSDDKIGSVKGLTSDLEIYKDMLRIFSKIPLVYKVNVDKDNVYNHN